MQNNTTIKNDKENNIKVKYKYGKNSLYNSIKNLIILDIQK